MVSFMYNVLGKVVCWLLFLLFVLYVINFVDWVNILVVVLVMNVDLCLSVIVYGIVVGVFFFGYVLF